MCIQTLKLTDYKLTESDMLPLGDMNGERKHKIWHQTDVI